MNTYFYVKYLFCFPDTDSSCDGADILLDTLTRQHTETLKLQVKDKLDHNCTDSSGQHQQVPIVNILALSILNKINQ